MFDTLEKRKNLSKWILSIFTCCILICFGMCYISDIFNAISWLIGLAKPLVIGVILALILNVPMSFFERNLRSKTKLRKGVRSLSIVLALVLVVGIFVGVMLLVIPELIEAIKLIVQIAGRGLDQMAQLETNADLMKSSIGQYFAEISIDWIGLKNQLEEWFRAQSSTVVNHAVGAVGSLAGSVVSFFIGLVFAIYILSEKEKLKRQAGRLIDVWLPKKIGHILIHVCSVCGKMFHSFIGGQATEAIILGTLCMIGMGILRIPYAPMVGALVGVTALIPVVGAFAGTIAGAVMIVTVSHLKAIVFLVFFVILQQFEGNIIYPRVIGAKINLPAIWVLAAVTVGGNLRGPLGMLLGVPAASVAYALLKEATDWWYCKRTSE